jgi:hypothetical protein
MTRTDTVFYWAEGAFCQGLRKARRPVVWRCASCGVLFRHAQLTFKHGAFWAPCCILPLQSFSARTRKGV